jgi:hypothetical protein
MAIAKPMKSPGKRNGRALSVAYRSALESPARGRFKKGMRTQMQAINA